MHPGHGNTNVLQFGLVIVALAVVVLVVYGIRRDTTGGSPIGVVLICFGLLFAGSITEGRASFGFWAGSQSRYTTFDLLILVGIYLALLQRPSMFVRAPSSSLARGESDHPRPEIESHIVGRSWRDSVSLWFLRLCRWACAVLILFQVPLGWSNGLQGANGIHRGNVQAVVVSLHIGTSSNAAVRRSLEPFRSASYIRRQVGQARRLHLGAFGASHPSAVVVVRR